MRETFVAIALSTVTFIAGHTALGQEINPDAQPADPTVTTWTKEKIDNPPAREIKFEVLKTAERRKLFREDAKLLEHKYVAKVLLQLPGRRHTINPFVDREPAKSQKPSSSDALGYMERTELGHFGNRNILKPFGSLLENRVPSKSLQAFLERVPEDRRAKLDELKFFTSDDVDQGYLLLATQHPYQYISEFHILARTQEEAERRATTLLALLDWGVTRPLQLKLLELHQRLAEQYPKLQESLLAAEADFAQLEEQSLRYAVTEQTLISLQFQQLQIDVDMAGVKARLAACDARLKADVTPERRTLLEALKLPAEIELAGCEARRAAADKLLERVTTWIQVGQDLVKARNVVHIMKYNLPIARDTLIHHHQFLDDYQPLPLVDGKVIIQPVEWTE